VVASTAEAVAGCTLVLGTTARARRSEAYEIFTPRDAAQTFEREGLGLMFGPEATGLSNEDLDHCQALVRIPTSAFSSLNLAQAVNLIAYEFFVSQVDAGKSKQPPDLAERGALERLYQHFLDAARHIGYADEANLRQTEHMYRRIVDRARLTEREVTALHGLWRQMVYAADHGPRPAAAGQEKR
jgi:TrmH family RNA methyltransferase